MAALTSNNDNVIRCPLCHGSGAVKCKEENKHINSACISLPLRDEERCNCCDGKGWIARQQQNVSLFCSNYLHK